MSNTPNYGSHGDESNPYRASDSLIRDQPVRSSGDFQPAGPWRRFVGAFADGIAAMVLIVPGFIVVGAFGGFDNNDGPPDNPVAVLVGFGMIGIGGLCALGIQMYLLATRSQSIGKYAMNMRVMDYQTRQPASFVKCFVIRGFVNYLLGVIPCVGGIYQLVDSLFVFSEEHRCIHDHLAGTIVVDIPSEAS